MTSALLRPGGRRTIVLGLLLAACGGEAGPSGGAVVQAVDQRPLTDLAVERTPERVARGEYLAEGPLHCFTCHAERRWDEPGAPPVGARAGAVHIEREGTYLPAPNLTPDVETGAGAWPDDALLRAIREGVGHDGRALGGMYWWAFRSLSDEDARAVVAYLRSLEPVSRSLGRRVIPADLEAYLAESVDPLTEPVAPPADDPLERGRYLISIADCGGCHSGWEAETMPGFMGGGNPISRGPASAVSANISPDTSGIGSWDLETFIGVMRSGRGGTLDATMPWVAFRNMTDQDLEAMYLALRALRPVRHWVNNVAEPTFCVLCGFEHGLGELNAEPRIAATAVDPARAAGLVGRYDFDGDTVEIALEDGVLVLREDGEATPLAEIEPGLFYGVGQPSPMSFEGGEEGPATALVSHEIPEVRALRVR